jgi:hypothetical protein
MSGTIAAALDTLKITITDHQIDAMLLQVASFEVRRSHPIALNSQLLGVYPISFIDTDRAALFSLFHTDEKTVKHLIQKIPAINPEFKVTSDAFNILALWLLHRSYRDIPDLKRREEFQLAVAKYLHYRFFTSLVNHYFQHGAVEKVMQSVIAGLSRKFYIIVYGTWKATIEARCRDLISEQSIHRQTMEQADDDKRFLGVLQDCQTRIRDQIKNVTQAYYEAHKRGDAIDSRPATTETQDGKILVHTAKTLDLMIFNLQNEMLTARLFVDTETVRSLSRQFSAISEDTLRSALLTIVDLADTQRDSRQLDVIKINDGRELYVGMRAFVANLIQKTYRYCMASGVDVTNRAAIYVKAKNIFSSSRIGDEDILALKQSVEYLVDHISTSRRETTKSSLRLCILLYIILRSFRFIA